MNMNLLNGYVLGDPDYIHTDQGRGEGRIGVIGKSIQVEDDKFKRAKLPCWVKVLKNWQMVHILIARAEDLMHNMFSILR